MLDEPIDAAERPKPFNEAPPEPMKTGKRLGAKCERTRNDCAGHAARFPLVSDDLNLLGCRRNPHWRSQHDP